MPFLLSLGFFVHKILMFVLRNFGGCIKNFWCEIFWFVKMN
jgi:hypothetical protein